MERLQVVWCWMSNLTTGICCLRKVHHVLKEFDQCVELCIVLSITSTPKAQRRWHIGLTKIHFRWFRVRGISIESPCYLSCLVCCRHAVMTCDVSCWSLYRGDETPKGKKKTELLKIKTINKHRTISLHQKWQMTVLHQHQKRGSSPLTMKFWIL